MIEPSSKDVELALPQGAEAASLARRFVAEQARALPGELVHDAEILVSELVTNAVLHGKPAIVLRVNLEPPLIGVTVEDAGDLLPSSEPTAPGPDSTHGRGLLIVDRLASAWGIDVNDSRPGKSVWFHIAADDGADADGAAG